MRRLIRRIRHHERAIVEQQRILHSMTVRLDAILAFYDAESFSDALALIRLGISRLSVVFGTIETIA